MSSPQELRMRVCRRRLLAAPLLLVAAACGTAGVESVIPSEQPATREFASQTFSLPAAPPDAAPLPAVWQPPAAAVPAAVDVSPDLRRLVELPPEPAVALPDESGVGASGGGGGDPAAPKSGGGGNSKTPIGYLDAPAIGLSTFILENGWNVKQLNRGGAGIGDGDLWSNGNVVLFGHRTSHGGPFRHVNDLNPGDELRLTRDDGSVRVYRIVDKFLDMPDAVSWADPGNTVDGKATITLITCAHADGSPGGTARRWFIRATAD